MPRWGIIRLARFWGRCNLWLLRRICDIHVEWRGRENIPAGALIVAAKHQSMWETFALLTVFPDPAFVVKRELMWIPFFGWYAWKGGMIAVARGGAKAATAAMSERARAVLAHGRQIVIFPEGTRRSPGAPAAYKYGTVRLYAETGATCLPIALNSGMFWPRRQFLRRPGTIRVAFLRPIAPGLEAAAFFERLQADIEAATDDLIAEAEREQI
ncbi:MAG: 1-acyl-sn-glycerol-3-phosphate acyltransferase [Proteobacteria bacterium]|nr:1-acyl-sn-glycerol-3-phosphate acyltransferase [Pseudomonadota bacterium]